jgi:hypothetical protein
MKSQTRRGLAALSLAPLLSLVVAACSGAPAAPTSAYRSPQQSSDACKAREKDARSEASAAVEAHRACHADADCVSVEIGNGCFDACTDSVNREGEAAIHAALEKSNAGGCARFAADGCYREVPPCAPPQAPTCQGGKCG